MKSAAPCKTWWPPAGILLGRYGPTKIAFGLTVFPSINRLKYIITEKEYQRLFDLNFDLWLIAEKKGMDMLKEYFLSIGNVCPSDKEVPSPTDADKQEDREDKESRDALSARLQSAQNSPHAGKITGAASRTGPYSARNRHVQNLVLPAYRGVYTRIHDEWKAKVEKTAHEDEEMRKQKEATRYKPNRTRKNMGTLQTSPVKHLSSGARSR